MIFYTNMSQAMERAAQNDTRFVQSVILCLVALLFLYLYGLRVRTGIFSRRLSGRGISIHRNPDLPYLLDEIIESDETVP